MAVRSVIIWSGSGKARAADLGKSLAMLSLVLAVFATRAGQARASSALIESLDWKERYEFAGIERCGRSLLRLRRDPGYDERLNSLGYQVRRGTSVFYSYLKPGVQDRKGFIGRFDGAINFSIMDSSGAGGDDSISARTFNVSGDFSPWSEPISARYLGCPRNSGEQDEDGLNLSVLYLPVAFADFSNEFPFSKEQLESEIVRTRSVSGESFSVDSFLKTASYGRVSVGESFHDWIVLPKTASDYCRRLNELGLGYNCRYEAIIDDANEILKRSGWNGPVTSIVYVVHGMGVAGVSIRTHDVLLAANRSFSKNSYYGSSQFSSILHELFHSFGLRHAYDIYSCSAGVVPKSLVASFDDFDCKVSRYGISLMGGGSSYRGVSGPQRYLLGWMDENRVERVSPGESQRVQIGDLDLRESENPQLVLIDRQYERNFLPSGKRMFLEYSSPGQRSLELEGATAPAEAGVRVGLYQARSDRPEVNESIRINEPALTDDADVLYFSDVSLQKVGDSARLNSLGISLEVISVGEDSIELKVSPLARQCSGNDSSVKEYDLFRRIVPGVDRVVERLRYSTSENSCDTQRVLSTSSFTGREDLVSRELWVTPGETIYSEREWYLLAFSDEDAIASELTVKDPSGRTETFRRTLFRPNGYSVEVPLRTEYLIPGQIVYATFVSQESWLSRTLTVDGRSVSDSPSTVPIRSSFVLKPGETRQVPLFRVPPEDWGGALLLVPGQFHADILEFGKLEATLSTRRISIVRPSCSDGYQNGEEMGPDCGGKCSPCPPQPAPVLSDHQGILLLLACLSAVGVAGQSRRPLVRNQPAGS